MNKEQKEIIKRVNQPIKTQFSPRRQDNAKAILNGDGNDQKHQMEITMKNTAEAN